MRNLFEPIPPHFDPWQFARQEQEKSYQLPLAQTQELSAAYGFAPEATIRLQLRGYVDSQKQCHLAGRVAAELRTTCARCLEALPLALDESFDYVLVVTEEQPVSGEWESLLCPDEELNLAWWMEEEVLLAIPMIAKHEHCEAPHFAQEAMPEDRPNPFAVLKNRKD